MQQKVDEFQIFIKLEEKRHIVAVTFFSSQEEYEQCEVKEATHQMFFCMMVKAAAVGHMLKVKKEHIYCSAASDVLGFTKPDKSCLNGKTAYHRNMYETEEIAEDIYRNFPFLYHKIYGMCIQPLERCKTPPDVVMVFGCPYVAMRLIQGYAYKRGTPKNLRMVGMSGICSEMMAQVYYKQDINISLLCSGTRFAGMWHDNELGISFPYSIFLEVLDGIKKTANTFEPDDKKIEILERAKKKGVEIKLDIGKNYHDSSIGVAPMGFHGYRRKR